jgi:hypothetical protein
MSDCTTYERAARGYDDDAVIVRELSDGAE